MKRCELCRGKALVLCESDQASLCWDCDAKVHCANFLVARHSRNLLCRFCQAPTPSSASGAKLGPTFSVCEKCFDLKRGDGCRGAEAEEGKEDGKGELVEENLVVPWSPPPESESSSSSKDSAIRGEAWVARKRCRVENGSSNLLSDEDLSRSSYQLRICTPPPADSAAQLTGSFSSPLRKLEDGVESGRRLWIANLGFSKEISSGRNGFG